MTYATQADLVDRFGAVELAQLTDELSGTTINAATVAQALADASAEIDGYLGVRYALPLTFVPPVIERICCDIARYYLFDDRVSEAVRNRYLSAVAMLKSMSAGSVTLGSAAAPAPDAAATGVTVRARSRTRVFGDDVLDSYGSGY
jgi:phage gp36-like protein